MTAQEFKKMSKSKMIDKLKKVDFRKDCRVYFSSKELYEIRNFAKKVVKKKMQEDVHKGDCSREVDRWMNGYLGELAVEKYLGLKFSDLSIGDSDDYAVPDLQTAGYKLGVKTCIYPNFPVINRNIHTPQIFVCVSEDRKMATILGLADVNLLKENLKLKDNDDLVYAKTMLDRKTVFSLIEKLDKVKTEKDIECYKK